MKALTTATLILFGCILAVAGEPKKITEAKETLSAQLTKIEKRKFELDAAALKKFKAELEEARSYYTKKDDLDAALACRRLATACDELIKQLEDATRNPPEEPDMLGVLDGLAAGGAPPKPAPKPTPKEPKVKAPPPPKEPMFDGRPVPYAVDGSVFLIGLKPLIAKGYEQMKITPNVGPDIRVVPKIGNDEYKEFLYTPAPALVVYNVPDTVVRFTAMGWAFRKDSKGLVFIVMSHGKEVYRSKPLHRYPHDVAKIDVKIPRTGRPSKTIALKVVPDDNKDVVRHAVWIKPRLYIEEEDKK